MAARRRNIGEDLAWLKWWLVLLAISLAIAIGGYWTSLYYRGEMRQLEFGTRSNFDVILQEVTQIEESERVIVENIDRFNSLAANRLLEEENRVSLLEDVRRIRDNFRLFPIDVEIREQASHMLDYGEGVEFPEEFISIRSSVVMVRFPLLHEEDLTRFLGAFLNAGRLMVSTSCTITASSVDPADALNIIAHQIASCDFIWYTFRRELPSEDPEFDEFAEQVF
ncbi:MAG: hypothetical protein COB20_00150 [SAR86 cluster bacterium]|uniref:Uncharacterized protein n=1 Tax=SAR86 cluster bacterium TaxID=2030880 RepID=A0A2A4XJW0_9GAMM|nr:MAG: hypothetical protein COB20_00150 [SAR86 cluster bacterium]